MKRKYISQNRFSNLKKIDHIVLFMSVVSLCLIIYISLSSLNNNIKNQEEFIHNTLSSLAENGNQQFEDYIQNKLDVLTYFTKFPDIYRMDPDRQLSFLYKKSQVIGFRHIFVMNMEGDGYYIDENYHRDQSDEPFFQDVMSHETFITEPFYNPDTKSTIITLCVSIYNKEQEKVGVLCGVIGIDKFKNVFYENQKNNKCFVIDADGIYAVSDDTEDVHNRISIYEHSSDTSSLIDKTFSTHQDQYGTMTLKGTEYYTYLTYIQSFNWVLGYQTPVSSTSKIFGYVNTMQLITILEVLILVFCIYHISYLWRNNNKKLYTDPLTGCSSRIAFFHTLHNLEKRQDLEIALLYMDLNGFKKINDTYGHDKGDLILCKFSDTLMTVLGKTGMVARLGGDEFAAILLNETEASIEEKWTQVQNLLKEKSQELPFDCQIQAAYGSSFRHKGGSQSLTDVLQRADENMYLCKEQMGGHRR